MFGLKLICSLFIILNSIENIISVLNTPSVAKSIDVRKVELCRGFANPYEITIKMNSDPKSANIKANIKKGVLPTHKMTIKLDKYDNKKWKKDFFVQEDSLCNFVNKVGSKAWVKFAQSAKPSFSTTCKGIPADKYEINNLQFSAKEFGIPGILKGTFKAHIKIKDGNNEILCLTGEMKLT